MVLLRREVLAIVNKTIFSDGFYFEKNSLL